jgi:hypothetical protein
VTFIELYVGDARFDDWEVVRDFSDLETAQAFCQLLDEAGLDAVITADHELDEFHHGDIALRVPPGKWSEANEALDAPEP